MLGSNTIHSLNQKRVYNGEIVAGSLLIPESRKIARLLLDNADDEKWHRAIMIDNILQKRSPSTAKREAALIKNRLGLMKPELWEMIEKGTSEISTQAVLASAIKHSRLLGDFMDRVVRQHWQTFNHKISNTDWANFWEICSQIDPGILEWSETTYSKLRQVVFRILFEAKYLDGTRTLKLQPVTIVPEVRSYLIKNSESYVLRCMEVTQ
jgi:phage-related protein